MGTPGRPEVVGGTPDRARSSWGPSVKARSGWVAFWKGQKWSRGPPVELKVFEGHKAGPEVIGGPFGNSGSGWRHSKIAVSDWGDPRQGGSGHEALRLRRKWLGGPLSCSEVVRGSSDRAGSGQGALRHGWKRSEGHLAGPEVVRGPFGRAGSGQGGLRQGRKWSAGHLAGPEVVGGLPAGPEVFGGPSGRAGRE